jgi:hypothetical protein
MENKLAKSNQQLVKQQEPLIGAWIKTTDEKEIYIAKHGKELQYFKNEDMNALYKTLVQWIYTLGLTNKVAENDIIALTTTTKDLFPNITLKEISLAVKLSLQNKLSVDVECYGNFSPLYISKILNSYIDYSKETMQNINWRKKSYDNMLPPPKDERTYEQKVEATKKVILFYSDWVKTKDTYVGDYNNVIWEFFKRLGMLDPTKVNLEEAEQWADDRIKLESITTQAKVFSKLTHEKKEIEFKKFRKLYGRYFVMKKIFREIENVQDWINNIDNKQILLQ